MSKRKGDHSYRSGSTCNWTTRGTKERFATEAEARRAMKRKRKWRGKDWPHPFFCEDCHGWHLGSGEGGWN